MDLVEEMHSNTHRHLPSYKHYTLVCDRGSLTLSSSNYKPMSCTKLLTFNDYIWSMFIDIHITSNILACSYTHCTLWVLYSLTIVLNDKPFIGYRGVLICRITTVQTT